MNETNTDTKPKQILVIKGWEGFADRLQVLSHGLHYCIVNNAILCVDWRDEMWGQGDTDFSDYFELVGVETTSIDVVAKRIVDGATHFPASWTPADVRAPMTKYIRMKHSVGKTEDILPNYTTRDEDIVILQNGLRTYHASELLLHLQFTRDVSATICSRMASVVLPYTAVHLRGTDRMAESMEPILDQTFQRFQRLPKYQTSRVYVVSDMKPMIDVWIARHPTSLHANPANGISKIDMGTTKGKGTHMLPKEVYEYYGLTKREMNVDTLTDFVVLAMANWCIGNLETESVFTKMARFIYDNAGSEGICAWIGDSYVPRSAPLDFPTTLPS